MNDYKKMRLATDFLQWMCQNTYEGDCGLRGVCPFKTAEKNCTSTWPSCCWSDKLDELVKLGINDPGQVPDMMAAARTEAE